MAHVGEKNLHVLVRLHLSVGLLNIVPIINLHIHVHVITGQMVRRVSEFIKATPYGCMS